MQYWPQGPQFPPSWLGVGNWTIKQGAKKSNTPNIDYEDSFNPAKGFINIQGKTYVFTTNDVTLNKVAPSQGKAQNLNPAALFQNHFVVHFTLNKAAYYFDPSYGALFQNANDQTAYDDLVTKEIQFVGTTLPDGKTFGFKMITDPNDNAVTLANIAKYIVSKSKAFNVNPGLKP